MSKRYLLVAVAIGALATTGTASAHPSYKPLPKHRITYLDYQAQAQQAATQYWGNSPCGGNVTIQYLPESSPLFSVNQAVISMPAGYHIAGYTQFATPDGPNDYSDAPATYTDCVISINKVAFPPDVWDDVWGWPEYCALMVHEYGHLEGYPDTTTDPPTSIKYQNITSKNDHIWSCGT